MVRLSSVFPELLRLDDVPFHHLVGGLLEVLHEGRFDGSFDKFVIQLKVIANPCDSSAVLSLVICEVKAKE